MSEEKNDIVAEEVVAEETAPVVEEAPAVEEKAEEPVVVEEKPAKAEKAAKPVKAAADKVAIHSNGNKTWSEVGKIKTGYNIVTKEDADKWLTIKGVRLATPEEVAKELDK